ncbi:MAG: hypothetical protein DYG89_10705 [Caldilinea sp. CFX5]|nr:hypothetical protein [Caldilinea sp. CFX5]
MSTYPIEKVLSEYAHERMTVEMAMGHCLQHIANLTDGQVAGSAEGQTLRRQVNALEDRLTSVQSQLDRLHPLPERLTTLTRTVAQLQAHVDRLAALAPPSTSQS